MTRVLPVLLLAACGQEYDLSTVQDPLGGVAAPPVREAAPPEPRVGKEPARPFPQVLPPLEITDVDTFDLGSDTPAEVADYLFVVDPSSSMERVLGSVHAGMAALSSQGVFPKEARIAVMSTTPADVERPGRPHPTVGKAGVAMLDPGFQGLVDAERIERARQLPSPFGERFGLDGCAAWFAPTDLNPQGLSCLVAHTQSPLVSLHVEAGLTALMQLLERGEPIFRPGAAVNVIFVSDTHDPGVGEARPRFDELMLLRPDVAELAELAAMSHELASFRVHAIAPERRCSAERWDHLGPVYLEAAVDSGGQTLDLCTAEPPEYVRMIREIAITGAVPQRAVVPVRKAGQVVEVVVGGAPVGFTISADGGAVVLDERVPERRKQVEVRYAVTPHQIEGADAQAPRRRAAPVRTP